MGDYVMRFKIEISIYPLSLSSLTVISRSQFPKLTQIPSEVNNLLLNTMFYKSGGFVGAKLIMIAHCKSY